MVHRCICKIQKWMVVVFCYWLIKFARKLMHAQKENQLKLHKCILHHTWMIIKLQRANQIEHLRFAAAISKLKDKSKTLCFSHNFGVFALHGERKKNEHNCDKLFVNQYLLSHAHVHT